MLCGKKRTVCSASKHGFTLVELLIVIVVIGVLSAMMMLSSTEAVSSARASNVISNLRNLKTAVLSWYTNNLDRIVKDGNEYKIQTDNAKEAISAFVTTKSAEILAYLNGEGSFSLKPKGTNSAGDYVLTGAVYSKKWYVCYNVGTDTKMKEKLASRAKTLNLVGIDTLPGGETGITDEYSAQKYVCMLVLSLED